MPLLIHHQEIKPESRDSNKNQGSKSCIKDPAINDIDKCIRVIKTFVDTLNERYIKCLTSAEHPSEIESCVQDVEKKVLDLIKKASNLTVCKYKGCTDDSKDHPTNLIDCLTSNTDRKKTLECLKGKVKPSKYKKHQGKQQQVKHSGKNQQMKQQGKQHTAIIK